MSQIIVKTILLYMVHLVPHMLHCFLKSRIIRPKNLYSPKPKSDLEIVYVVSINGSMITHGCIMIMVALLIFIMIFCFYCMKHSSKLTTEKNKDPAFITAGFKSWHKALECFKDHQKSKCHRGAATFEVIVPSCSDPSTMMSEQLASQERKRGSI